MFTDCEARRIPQPTRRDELHTVGHPSDDPCSEVTASESKSWLVGVTENITVAPRCRHIAIGKLEVEKGQKLLISICRTGTYSHTRNPARSSSFASRSDSAADDTSDITAHTKRNSSARKRCLRNVKKL